MVNPAIRVSDLNLQELFEIRRELEEQSAHLERENRIYRRECQQKVPGAYENLTEVRTEQAVVLGILTSVCARISFLRDEAKKTGFAITAD